MFNLPIETERLIIRRFEKQDLKNFLSFILDPEAKKYYVFDEQQKTKEGAKELFNFITQNYNNSNHVDSYLIALKSTGEFIGSCGFMPYDEGITECYYYINQGSCGKGYAVEAITELAKLLSITDEVRVYCDIENIAAQKVAMRSGFTKKGLSINKNTGRQGFLFSIKT